MVFVIMLFVITVVMNLKALINLLARELCSTKLELEFIACMHCGISIIYLEFLFQCCLERILFINTVLQGT